MMEVIISRDTKSIFFKLALQLGNEDLVAAALAFDEHVLQAYLGRLILCHVLLILPLVGAHNVDVQVVLDPLNCLPLLPLVFLILLIVQVLFRLVLDDADVVALFLLYLPILDIKHVRIVWLLLVLYLCLGLLLLLDLVPVLGPDQQVVAHAAMFNLQGFAKKILRILHFGLHSLKIQYAVHFLSGLSSLSRTLAIFGYTCRTTSSRSPRSPSRRTLAS